MSEAGQPRIIPVFVVVPPWTLLLDIAGPMEVLRRANLDQEAVRFTVRYVGPAPSVTSSIGLDLAPIAPLPDRLPDGALVVISGSVDEPLGTARGRGADDAAREAEIVDWLKRSIRPGIRLVSICSGALLAARAGLLDGHECTTHHATIGELMRLAPGARVRENRLYVEDGERLTSAGVTAGIDLMLHLVAREAGHAAALAVARDLVVYLRRAGGDPQLSPWLEGRNHIHPAVHRVQDAVGADPARNWSVAALARVAGTSPRNLSRLFNQHAGMSVTEYVNRMRIAMARELVIGSRLDMETVAERTGFSSARQLRRVWNRLHETPPTRLRASFGPGLRREDDEPPGTRARLRAMRGG
ncbi:GlxA family transcriptional regulator [Chelatococcus composti]|jgi:Transcriptional regulator containing an amidase domain and an AraC-type DNA-binding HTH domain|uniref:Transcriptional regulator GlxA family with amidase domain n=1 Tax=Chelatococcus composti TaxID=1743235 RepID=A0A841KB31_9HYPH|nr:helix-turn-helix domain-containing protein [Chelatococcus composti]MBB6168622.1 transcriptional regulator GlxA family with amidase domain [Chelatococcus composti]MBS7736299.1 helix-turn-helix domain-containing protein [Chelatococcus composti]PZN44883.1 MAG: AraC family transcriptional regulator [Pseudomonadota bacterium]GGG41451.1 transcriptional regulator [Chelatococcus composti]